MTSFCSYEMRTIKTETKRIMLHLRTDQDIAVTFSFPTFRAPYCVTCSTHWFGRCSCIGWLTLTQMHTNLMPTGLLAQDEAIGEFINYVTVIFCPPGSTNMFNFFCSMSCFHEYKHSMQKGNRKYESVCKMCYMQSVFCVRKSHCAAM